MNVEESAALWRMYLQCSAIWQVSIFTDSILICPGRTSLVLRCLYPSSITNPRALFLVSRKPSSPVFDLLTLFSVMSHVSECEPPVPTLGHIWDVMLVWRKGNNEKNCRCYGIVYYYNGAQRYEQFLQVGWLYRALIFFGLALCFPSASVSLVFMVLYVIEIHFAYMLLLTILVSRAWWDWPLT